MNPDDESSMALRNVRKFTSNYTAHFPKGSTFTVIAVRTADLKFLRWIAIAIIDLDLQ
jgi:hypothetical protein